MKKNFAIILKLLNNLKQVLLFTILSSTFLSSCQSPPAETAIDSLAAMAADTTISTASVAQKEEPKKEEPKKEDIIYESSKLEFIDSRKKLLTTSEQEGLVVSELNETDNSLQYTVTYPNNQGTMEEICYPHKGEVIIGFTGNKDIAKLYLNGAALSKDWEIHRTTENGEYFEKTEKLPNFPLKVHYTITYTQKDENVATYLSTRKTTQIL